jgi:DnaK suppressor protein
VTKANVNPGKSRASNTSKPAANIVSKPAVSHVAKPSASNVAKPSVSSATKPAPAKPVASKPVISKPAPTKILSKKAAAPAPRKAPSPVRKTATGGNGSSAGFVDGLARRLDEHRREILHLYRHDLVVGLDAFRDGDDEIDRANFDSDRDLALSLSDSEREVLLQIEEALSRIASGEFGSCTSCSKPIGEQRLHAIPWARYCIDCQELEEKGLLG